MDLSSKNKWIVALAGSLAGFVNGFLGGGGGVIVVSALLAVGGLKQKSAQATALLIILPLTLVSAAVYVFQGNVMWIPTFWTTIGVVGGGVVGALLLGNIKGNVAKILFAAVLILGGVKMFF